MKTNESIALLSVSIVITFLFGIKFATTSSIKYIFSFVLTLEKEVKIQVVANDVSYECVKLCGCKINLSKTSFL